MDLNFNSWFWILSRPFKLSTRKSQLVTRVLPYHVQTVISSEIFSLINFTLVTRMWENKSARIIKLVTRSEILFFNIELVTQKRKNKSLAIELVTRSVTFCFSTWVSNLKVKQKSSTIKLVTRIKFIFWLRVSNSKCSFLFFNFVRKNKIKVKNKIK